MLSARPCGKMWHWIAIQLLVAVGFNFACKGDAIDQGSVSAAVFWWTPVVFGPLASTSSHLIFSDVLRASTGPATILASDHHHPVLLQGISEIDQGKVVPLPIDAEDLRIARGPADSIWIGGQKFLGYSELVSYRAEAYLARFDDSGHLLWEHRFQGQRQETIESLVSLPSGDVVVAGKGDGRTWLARISSRGEIIWERYVGVDKGADVTLVGDQIALVAFETNETEDAVALWRFDMDGQTLGRRVVREALNHSPNYYWHDRPRIEQFQGAVYVFTGLTAVFSPSPSKPLEVDKFDSHGDPIWRKELPETLLETQSGKISVLCEFAAAVLSNGDPLIACRLHQKTLFHLKAGTGALTRQFLQLPKGPAECDGAWSQIKFLEERDNGALWFFGSPTEGDGATVCAWVGQAPAADVDGMR
jgi:hypothetical protein